MRNIKKTFAALALALAPASTAWSAASLAARFGEVVFEGAVPGRSYNLRERLRRPFAIENRSDAEMEVSIEFLLPRASSLAAGYELVADPGWLQAAPRKLVVAARSVGYFDVILAIPDDPVLIGKRYQAALRAESSGQAIEEKVRFSISQDPQVLLAEKKKAALKLDFEVTPRTLWLQGVPVGSLYDVRKGQQKSLRVANYDPRDLVLRFASQSWDNSMTLPEDYQPAPESGWIVFKSSQTVVEAGAIKQAGFFINVPDKPEYRGKKFAALIRTGLSNGFWFDAPVKVYFETEKQGEKK